MVNDVDYDRFKHAFITAVKKDFSNDEHVSIHVIIYYYYFNLLLLFLGCFFHGKYPWLCRLLFLISLINIISQVIIM